MSSTVQRLVEVVPPAIGDGVKAAMESTFLSILGTNLVVFPGEADPGHSSGIVGLISFIGDVSWSFSLGIPETTAPGLILKFAGFEIPFESSDMCDVVGELANVIAGDIVAQLDRRRVTAKMSLPMVIRGNDVEVTPQGDALSLRMCCTSPYGPFWYKLAVARAGSLEGRKPGT